MVADERADPFADFEGFTEPHYTPTPDQFADDFLRYLSGAETKIMVFLFRQTLGWKRATDKLSSAEIARRTGLTPRGVRKTMRALEEKGLVTVHRATTRAGDPDTNIYGIRWDRGVRNSVPNRAELSSPPRTRDRLPRDNTPSIPLADLAEEFLHSIGYARPSKAKRERTLRILHELLNDDGYTIEELQAACKVAVSLGARGPELIPHVVGQAPPASSEIEMRDRSLEAHNEERIRWQQLAQRFDALPKAERVRLLAQAKSDNPILAKRPDDHPLVRAAAVVLAQGGDRNVT